MGYKIMNQKIEEDQHYYKRMFGVLHLYFTFLMMKNNNSNNNGFKKAWQWLADVLNMTPRPNITAEMLSIYFKCCGSTMQKTYGIQFIKLVRICYNDFMPLIKSIPNDQQSGASVGRLQSTFDSFFERNKFSEWIN
jgi:nucleoporin GLE1